MWRSNIQNNFTSNSLKCLGKQIVSISIFFSIFSGWKYIKVFWPGFARIAFIRQHGHATYDHPGATRGSRLRVTVHTSSGEQLFRGVTRTSSFHPRSSRPIRFLRISYHTRHPSRAPAPCLGHQLPRPEPLRSPTGTSTTILARERAVLCHCGCARLFAHNLFRAR